MTKECVIYDDNEEYAKRLMNAISVKAEGVLMLQLFTQKNRLEKYLLDKQPDVLIVSEKSYFEGLSDNFTNILAVLTENIENDDSIKIYGNNAVGIYRYQPLERIYGQLVEKCGIKSRKGNQDAYFVGIYSPVSELLRSGFSLTLSKVLSEKGKTLYLNFEEFSGLGEILCSNNDNTLSDALYFYRQSNTNNMMRIRDTIVSKNGVDYIPPVRCAEDISYMDSNQIMEFIESIAREEEYEYVVIDISSAIKQPWKIVGCCDRVYMPVKKDYLSVKCIQEFETYFCGAGREKLLDLVIKISIPEGENYLCEDFWEKLLYSGMYRYVKKLVEGGM